VALDASGSTDLNGDRLKFQWSLSAPRGSGAKLDNTDALRPQFTVDLLGEYTATLIVNDGRLNSVLDTVTISTGNVAPVAVIDKQPNIGLGESVVLKQARALMKEPGISAMDVAKRMGVSRRTLFRYLQSTVQTRYSV